MDCYGPQLIYDSVRIYKGTCEMSSKNNATPSKTRSEPKPPAKSPMPFSNIEFVNIYLSEEDKRALKLWEVSGEDYLLVLAEWVENGYKVSLSPDFSHDSFIVSITGKECTPPENKDRCLSSRGSTLENALASMMFKVQNKCPDGIFPDSTGRSFGDFG